MDILTTLKDTPIPTILVAAGIFFLMLSIVTQLGGKIKVSRGRQNTAIVIGILLVASGIGLYLFPTNGAIPFQKSAPTILGVTIRENHEGKELVIDQEINFYDEDGNTNVVEWELIELSDPTQRQFINLQNGTINDPPEVQKIRSSTTGTWHCGGHIYVATLDVFLVDKDSNRSKPVRYTIDCN